MKDTPFFIRTYGACAEEQADLDGCPQAGKCSACHARARYVAVYHATMYAWFQDLRRKP